jgi:nucleosome binding factor SPN SPT16 subunit
MHSTRDRGNTRTQEQSLCREEGGGQVVARIGERERKRNTKKEREKEREEENRCRRGLNMDFATSATCTYDNLKAAIDPQQQRNGERK